MYTYGNLPEWSKRDLPMLTRKPGQSVLVQLEPAIFENFCPDTGSINASIIIKIVVTRIDGNQVGNGIQAHPSVNVAGPN